MKKKTAFLVVAVLVAAAGSFWLWSSPVTIVSTRAVVEGHVATVSAAVSGTVKDVSVKEGEVVTQGQPLLALDASGMERQLAQERARLAELAAQLPPHLRVSSPGKSQPASSGKPLSTLRMEEEEARRQLEITAGSYAAANAAFARMHVGSPSEYAKPDPKRQAALITRDEAAVTLKKARDAYEKISYARARREMQEKQERDNGPVSAALAARIAEYESQISKVRLAEQDIAAAVLSAPENGTVIFLAARPGDMIHAGDVPARIAPEEKGERWILASFAGDDKAGLAEGLACEITFEGSSVTARGRLARLGPDVGTEKTVAARVILDKDELPMDFLPGKAASVTVLTGRGNPQNMLKAIMAKN